MAIEIVNKKQTGSTNSPTLTITSATAGNLLIAFAMQTSTLPPRGKDNISGEAGWSVEETHAIFSASLDGLFVMIKSAVGGETKLEPVAGGGAIQGISYFELKGAQKVEAITHKDNNPASSTTATSEPITTTDANDIILACVGMNGASGVINAWTGTGPLTNVETASSHLFGGSLIPAATETAATFTANWTNAHAAGILTIAIKPPAGNEVQKMLATLELAGKGKAAAVVHAFTTPNLIPVGVRGATIVHQFVTPTITPIATLFRTITQFFGTVLLSSTAFLGKAIDHPFAEAIVETVQKLFGSLTLSGELNQETVKQFLATIKPNVTLGQVPTALQRATLTVKGAVRPFFVKSLEVILFPSGVILPFIKGKFIQPLSAVVTYSGSLLHGASHGLAGRLELQGALGKALIRQLIAKLEGKGALGKALVSVRTATLEAKGTLSRALSKRLTAASTFVGTLNISARSRLSAILTPTGILGRLSTVNFRARLEPLVTIRVTVGKALSGSLTFTGSLIKTILSPKTATLRPEGALARAISATFKATLSFAASISRSFIQPITAVLSFIGSQIPIAKIIYRIFPGLVNPRQKSGTSSPHESEGEG